MGLGLGERERHWSEGRNLQLWDESVLRLLPRAWRLELMTLLHILEICQEGGSQVFLPSQKEAIWGVAGIFRLALQVHTWEKHICSKTRGAPSMPQSTGILSLLFPNTCSSPWQAVNAQEMIVGGEWSPGTDLRHLKGQKPTGAGATQRWAEQHSCPRQAWGSPQSTTGSKNTKVQRSE